MKNGIKRSLAAVILGITLSAIASAQKIDYQVAPGIDFSQYRTYSWERAQKAIYPEKELDDMFIKAIEAELSKKGLTRAASDVADLIVVYQIAILDDMEWSAGHSTIPFLGNVGAPGLQGGPVGGSNQIKKGFFILDIYDGKSKKQIWQAYAKKTLANTTDIGKRTKNTQKAMAKIFKNYPPE